MEHDAHAAPPSELRVMFKQWQKSSRETVESSPHVLDTSYLGTDGRVSKFSIDDEHHESIARSFEHFMCNGSYASLRTRAVCFEVKALPGLFLYPSLLPVDVQAVLLDKVLHRDLSNPNHTNNLHLHYDIPSDPEPGTFPSLSFFELDSRQQLQPKDGTIHKPKSIKQVLEKNLRWVTLGGQYDWSNKVYPDEMPPPFPQDIADLLKGIFRTVEPQAAILNLYSPGDTLSLHRDVSEECDQALISVSIGCDALFLVANSDGTRTEVIRLRSGDVILMSGESRYAWHAVPKVVAGTCPHSLQDWPYKDTSSSFPLWRGWLTNKRINLNVRQMR